MLLGTTLTSYKGSIFKKVMPKILQKFRKKIDFYLFNLI